MTPVNRLDDKDHTSISTLDPFITPADQRFAGWNRKVPTEVSEEGSNSVGTDEGYERSSRGLGAPTKVSDFSGIEQSGYFLEKPDYEIIVTIS